MRLAVTLVMIIASVATAQDLIALRLEGPATVELGRTFTVNLVAVSDVSNPPGVEVEMVGGQVVERWDPEAVTRLGFTVPPFTWYHYGTPFDPCCHVNEFLDDGDAWFYWMRDPAFPPVQTTFVVATFWYEATALGETTIWIEREHASGAYTAVVGPGGGLNILGELYPLNVEVIPSLTAEDPTEDEGEN